MLSQRYKGNSFCQNSVFVTIKLQNFRKDELEAYLGYAYSSSK